MIYIAGPMSDIQEFNYPAFREAARTLREQGYIVYSPHEVYCNSYDLKTWKYYARKGLLVLIEKCDSLALLPGWETSKGATLEFTVATVLGLTLYDYVDGELVER